MNDRDTPYRPIDCDTHDVLEAAILQGHELHLVWHGDDGLVHTERLRPSDVVTAGGAEWLEACSHHGEPLRLRLDRIIRVQDVAAH